MSQVIKRKVEAKMVKLLFHRFDNRGMVLSEYGTRGIRVGEIHELVTTRVDSFQPGKIINEVGFIGFVEISVGGIIQEGDIVKINGITIGKVIGFDVSHYPNHYNILINTGVGLATAEDYNVSLEQIIEFDR